MRAGVGVQAIEEYVVATAVDQFRQWAQRHARDDIAVGTWWRRLSEAGWAFPHWPAGLGGRGVSIAVTRAVHRAMAELGLLGPPQGHGVTMLAPTLLAHGSHAQLQRFLPAIARGEITACQLFSEPEAGSDLASLRTRAVIDGEVWVIDGQKVWSSGARDADVGMLLARTDPTAPKHRGITYFLVQMAQPGVDVRPLRQMNGLAEFNETFLDAVVVPDEDRLGGLGDGWAVAQSTLAAERSASPPVTITVPGGGRAGWLERPVRDAVQHATTRRRNRLPYSRSGQAAAALARRVGRVDDPLIRQAIADLHTRSQIQKLTAARLRSAKLSGGPQLLKLQAAEIARLARDVDLLILGASAIATDDGRFDDVVRMALSAHVVSIGGGTDEVQRNILAERALGLPKEPDVSRDLPFEQIARSTPR